MYKIVEKKILNPTVIQLWIEAPLVANKAKPGQFIILRVDEDGERIPLTVAGVNKENGTVKIIFQVVGATTEKLNRKMEGDYLQDFVGPLGRATETEGLKKVAVVGGGENAFEDALYLSSLCKEVHLCAKKITASDEIKTAVEEKENIVFHKRILENREYFKKLKENKKND